MSGNIVISQINGGAIGVKNVIINGNFQINQRGVSGTVTLAAGAYGHDRFKAGASGCTYTFATSNNVTTLTISAGSLIQVVEGLNLYTDTYTLSWTGTAQGKIGAGSYAGSGVTGSVTGGTNLNIEFNTGTLSLVQLEAGSVATPFERRDYGRELMMCQRYYCKQSVFIGNTYAANGGNVSASTYVGFKVTMRASPTITFVNTSALLTNADSATFLGPDGFSYAVNITGTGTFNRASVASMETEL
jgi:hypothetical protein